MIELALGKVRPSESDLIGHMSVQYYVARAVDCLPVLGVELGLGPRRCRELNIELAATEHHLRFHNELGPEAGYSIGGGILGIENEQLRLYQEIRNIASGDVAATIITMAAAVDSASRARRPLPLNLLARTASLIVDLPDYGAPRGIDSVLPRPRPVWDEADRLGLMTAQQSTVIAEECDGRGFFTARAVMERVTEATPHQFARLNWPAYNDGSVGWIVLESRLVYHANPRLGDVLTLRCGLVAIGTKTTRWVHWVMDRETGEAVATVAAVIAVFDLAARKVVTLDDSLRQCMESRLVPALSA